MIVTANSASTFEPCPAGSYLARLARLIDLGTQPVEFNGETKQQHKALLTFEILDPDVHRDDGRLYTVSKRYSLSLHPKAGLRKDLASWRGRDFTDDELKGFDLKTILGQKCMLSVVHDDKGDRVFANIAALMKAPRGMSGCEPTEPILHFDLAAPHWPTFEALGEKLKSQISSSPEYTAARKSTPPTAFDDMDSDVPF